MHIILIGIQGSGKSTQGQLLSKDFGVPYLSTGDIFRKIAQEDTLEGRYIKKKMSSGILIPDEKVNPLIEEYLDRDTFEKGYVLDGFPRTVSQAKAFSSSISKVFYLKLSDKIALERIAKRSDTRDDETEDAIRKRIELFHEQTEPVIAYYRGKELLADIDGEKSVEEVFEQIKQNLE